MGRAHVELRVQSSGRLRRQRPLHVHPHAERTGVRAAVRIGALRTRLRGVACITVLLSACHQQPTTAPSWPVEMQLLLVNTTTDAVFVRAEGDASLSRGTATLPPRNGAWCARR